MLCSITEVLAEGGQRLSPEQDVSSGFIPLKSSIGLEQGDKGSAGRGQGDVLASPLFWDRERDSVSYQWALKRRCIALQSHFFQHSDVSAGCLVGLANHLTCSLQSCILKEAF